MLHYLHSDVEASQRLGHGDPWAAHSIHDKVYQAGKNYVWHSGPRSCDCLRQLFELVQFRAPSDYSMAYACVDADLHTYLEDPLNDMYNMSWRYVDAITLKETPYRHVSHDDDIDPLDWHLRTEVPASSHVPTSHIRHLAPLSQCPGSCSGLGYCVMPSDTNSTHVCVCYPDVGKATPDHSCEPALHLHRCISRCSGHGDCVLGFCKCHAGFFGVDCALALHPEHNQDAVPYNALASSPVSHHVPLFYFADLPAQYTITFGSGRRIEKFIAHSRYRAANPAKAFYFWHLSSDGGALNLASWRWLERNCPQFQDSIKARFANWITTQPFDHGFASGSLPGQGWKDTAEELDAYGKFIHPNSPDRVLLAYMLNERIDGVGAGQKGCFVCFQRDKDIAVPAHPWDLDGAGSTRFSNHVPVSDYTQHSPWRANVTGEQWPARKYLMFFAASQTMWPVSGRPQLKRFMHDARFLLGGAGYESHGIAASHGARQATFCYTPFGMIGGYTGRHIHAVMLGCIPVWWVPEKCERSVPFEPSLGSLWANASVTVHERDIERLPEILESYDAEAIARMRDALGQLWQSLLWSTITKTREPIWEEDGRHDAVHQLFVTLARKADQRFNTTLEQQILSTLPSSGATWL